MTRPIDPRYQVARQIKSQVEFPIRHLVIKQVRRPIDRQIWSLIFPPLFGEIVDLIGRES